MSEFKKLPSTNKLKLSNPKKDSKRFKNNTDKGNKVKLEGSTCPVRVSCSRETEKLTTKVNNEEEECRSESLSPPRKLQIIGHSSSTGFQSSTSINQSSNNTSLDSDVITSKNLHHDNDTNSPLSFGCSLSGSSSFTSSFERSLSSGLAVSPISSRYGFQSPSSSSVQPQTDSTQEQTGSHSSTSINQSSNNTSLDSDVITIKNLQHDNNTNSPLSFGCSLSGSSSFTSSFERSLSSGLAVPPILSRYGFQSPSSSLVEPQTDSTQEQANEMLSISNLTNSRNYLSKHSDKSIHISDDEMSVDCSQTNDFDDNDDLNTNDVISEEGQLFQMDPSLRQFDVLDELEVSDQEEGEIMESNSEKSDSEFDEELPIDDIDELLEEGLPEKLKSSKNKECPIQLRKKVVLEEIGHDHFDLLPEGWIQIMHSSGMPVYLNQKSRVCTMARPYFLGPGSSRNHKIPLSAIPCLHYKRASELEKKNEEAREKKKQSQNHQSQSEIELMSAEIETFEENKATQSLEASELHEYCKNKFKFKTLTLIPFKSWADRRRYVKMRRENQRKQRQRPTLPGGTKLIKFPIRNPDGTVSKTKGEWIINPNGKSYVCILHEYIQHALKKHPKYEFKELQNSATPYLATVFIEEMKYGIGMGTSKKHAKVEAAKAALEVLIPGMKDKIEPDSQFCTRSGTTKRSDDTDISIFDQIKVEDPRVAEFCAKSTEPPPYTILLTCLNRNTGIGEIAVSYEMSSTNFSQDKFTMIVGNHKATVACKNKREGKQRAAQAILKKLHPNVTFWGSLLRMYGNRSIKEIKEKKQAELEITQLQSKATLNQPNFAILDKLKTEMSKLKNKKDALKGRGTFVLPENIILPSLSSTDLNKVNLSNK